MAHHRQRIKRYRNSLKNQARNHSNKSSIKTFTAKLSQLVQENKKEEAQKLSSLLFSKIDKAVKYSVLHKKNAARRKARVSKISQPLQAA